MNVTRWGSYFGGVAAGIGAARIVAPALLFQILAAHFMLARLVGIRAMRRSAR